MSTETLTIQTDAPANEIPAEEPPPLLSASPLSHAADLAADLRDGIRDWCAEDAIAPALADKAEALLDEIETQLAKWCLWLWLRPGAVVPEKLPDGKYPSRRRRRR